MLAFTFTDYLMQTMILIITSNLIEELDPYFTRWLLNNFQKIAHKDCYNFGWLGHAMSRGLVNWLILLIGSEKINTLFLVIWSLLLLLKGQMFF
jgi:hypothetical protein